VVLLPVHLVLDSLVRWPLVQLSKLGEEHHIFPWLRWFFVWRDGRMGLIPTFLYEFGLSPSVGIYFFADDLLGRGHQLTLHGGFWSHDWIAVQGHSDWQRPGGVRLGLHGRYVRRPDQPFFGIGPATLSSEQSYYRRNIVDAWGTVSAELGGLNRFSLRLGYRRASFAEGQTPSIDTFFDAAAIPGFAGYSLVGGTLRLALDTRQPRLTNPETGLRLELFTAYRIDPGNRALCFVRWGGEAAGMLDLTGRRHVLGLRVFAAGVENVGTDPVPFTELIVMGGRRRMRGYLWGRFRGESALEITTSYRYPIWAYLDAELFLNLGNAFSAHFEEIALQRMFLGWGLALRTAVKRDISFDLIVGGGTSRLDSRLLKADSFSFTVGLHPGF